MAKDKSPKPKITKDTVPENFTLGLCFVDALPVIFFGVSAVLISLIFGSKLFLLGAVLVLLSGVAKVAWKFIVVLAKKNVWPLFIQMRILMPIGYLLMILALILNHSRVSFRGIWAGITSMPSLIFFLIGVLGMALMIVFAKKLDSSDVKANWIEQTTNGVAQGAIMIGLIFLL